MQLDSGSRAREVVVSCPYWIVNKTNLTMKVKDTTLNASQPVATPPGLGGQAEPVMFRCHFPPLQTLLCSCHIFCKLFVYLGFCQNWHAHQ